jgi:hypothetical protein
MVSIVFAPSDLGTDTVTFYVGPNRQHFVVHKNLLVTQSNYFKGALTGTLYKEATEGVVNLEEDDPDSFRLLVAWLYTGRIPRVRPFVMRPDFSKLKSKSKKITSAPAKPVLTTTGRILPDLGVRLPEPDGVSNEV